MDTDLECVDECKVVQGDVVVVVLDVTEGAFVVLHQGVDLAVLALLNLVDLRLAPQVQFVAQRAHLAFVLEFDLPRLPLEVRAKVRDRLVLRLHEHTQ